MSWRSLTYAGYLKSYFCNPSLIEENSGISTLLWQSYWGVFLPLMILCRLRYWCCWDCMYQNLWCFIFHRLEEGGLHSCTLWSLQSFHQFSVEGQLWGCAFYQWLQPLFERLLFSFVLCLVSSLLLKPQMELKPSTSHCHLILLPHLNHLLLHQSLRN